MHKKILILSIFILTVCAITGCSKKYSSMESFYKQMEAKKATYQNMSYLMKFQLGEIKTQSTVKIKNDLIRIESSLDGGKNYPTVAVKTKDGSYTYIPSINTAYETSEDPVTQLDVLDWGKGDLSEFKFGKRFTVNNEKCLMINFVKENAESHYCISEKYGIPIYIDIKMGEGNSQSSMKVELLHISDKKIADIYFKLPSNVKVIRKVL